MRLILNRQGRQALTGKIGLSANLASPGIINVKWSGTVTNTGTASQAFVVTVLKDSVVLGTVAINGGAALAPGASSTPSTPVFSTDVPGGIVATIIARLDSLPLPGVTNLASISKKVSGPKFTAGQQVHVRFPQCALFSDFFGTVQSISVYQQAVDCDTALPLDFVWAFYNVVFSDPRINPIVVFQECCLE